MRALVSLALILAAVVAGAQSQTDAVVEPTVVEEVLVTGQQPGPGLWRVTRDGKTLWILGMHGPLPQKMTWVSRDVESIVAESQRVVRWVKIETEIEASFFAKLRALPAIVTMNHNPGGARLQEVVSEEAYRQWQTLKARYARSANSLEKMRPAFAVTELRGKALHAEGLSEADPEAVVWPAVRRFAKQHKVEILEPELVISLKVDKPSEAIKQFRAARLPDAECFARSLSLLESDLDAMKAHANAWATGDVEVLRQIPRPDPGTDCWQLLLSSLVDGSLGRGSGAEELAENARQEVLRVFKEQNELWVRTVEDTLRENSSVLAVVPVSTLFDPQGPLQTLRDRGYEVDEP